MNRERIGYAFAWLLLAATGLLTPATSAQAGEPMAKVKTPKQIKAYCIDYNWATHTRRHMFASPGSWSAANPADYVKWYKTMGANVIQTFAVSANGYAWYKNGFVPEQPGLKYDFLPQVVKLGHRDGMVVIGYFCVGANGKWAKDHPDMSYGTPSRGNMYHIPYTDEYLDYLCHSISDAIRKTGIDGIMLDWVWMPTRKATHGKWLACEKKLYEQEMGKPFPGEDKLTKEQKLAYNRATLARVWDRIHKAAKEANPNCIIWLTVNHPMSKDVINSKMYKQVDWLMDESGHLKTIEKLKPMVSKDTRLITCLALWNGQDALKVVPEAIKRGIGLYGFTRPTDNSGLIPLEPILSKPVNTLKGDKRSIAALARAYNGVSIDAKWENGHFVEPGK